MADSLKTFEEMECYRLARELRKDLVRTAKSLPADERFRLTDQLVRASRSVTANIAEGLGDVITMKICSIAGSRADRYPDALTISMPV